MVLVVLAFATAHQAAVALEVLSLGTVPGDGAAGNGAALAAGLGALLAAAVLAAVLPHALTALAAPAATAFLIARFYTYDPYYLPGLRRISDGGLIPAAWVLGLGAVCVVAGLATRLGPRWVAPVVTAPLLVVCAVTAFLLGTGH